MNQTLITFISFKYSKNYSMNINEQTFLDKPGDAEKIKGILSSKILNESFQWTLTSIWTIIHCKCTKYNRLIFRLLILRNTIKLP